jgi:spore coat protein U-like protein
MKKLLLVSVLAALSSIGSLAVAAQVTASFDVKLTVQKACNVSAGTAIDFGSVASTSTTDLAGSTTISVTCSNRLPYTIGLTSTKNPTSTTGAGLLKGATTGNTDTVGYQLRKATGTGGAIWGNTVGTNTLAVSGTGLAQSQTVYATLPGTGLNVQADTYSDTVTVSVDY